MKHTMFPLIMMLCIIMCNITQEAIAQTKTGLAKPRVIKNPEIEHKPFWFEFDEIELTKDATVIRGNLHHQPNWRVKIYDNSYLVDRHTDKQYKIKRAEGIEMNKEMSMPESGRMPCTLYFDPLDADATDLNYIEPESRPKSMIYGIKLHSKPKASKKSNKAFDPKSLTRDYYLKQAYTPDTEWRFDNKRYKEDYALPLRSGKAQLIIHLDRVPEELHTALDTQTAYIWNQMTWKEIIANAICDAEKLNWTFDLDLPHPQWVMTMGDAMGGYIFVQPGDTLEVFTTLITNEYDKPIFTTYRGNSESAIINSLTDRLINEYKAKEVTTDQNSPMQKINHRRSQVIDIIEGEEFRQALIHTPLSTFGKDVVTMNAIADIVERLWSAVDSYEEMRLVETEIDGKIEYIENTDIIPLDMAEVYAPILKYKDLIFDNPIALCISETFFISNAVGSSLLGRKEYANGSYKEIFIDDYNMAGTFMYDIRMLRDITSTLKENKNEFLLSGFSDIAEFAERYLEIVANSVGSKIITIRSPKIAHAAMNEYRSFVKATENKAGGAEAHWTDEQRALWKKLFGPYRGNLLFVDFWAMSCGPCRAGMLGMRDIVEELKDEPIKFIYVASETDTPRETGERWTTENNIKGEHIYVTKSEWAMLQSMLSIHGIPHYTICGPDSHVLSNDYWMVNHDAEVFRRMVKKHVKE